MPEEKEKLHFLTEDRTRTVAEKYDTPVFVYSAQKLKEAAQEFLAIPAPFGKTIRYAMKANPHRKILSLLYREGLHIDASSLPEVERAVRAGIPPEAILLTSQQKVSTEDLRTLHASGASYTATSLKQLERFGEACPDKAVSVRINPGVGIGATNRTKTGGRDSSFGIWHEHIPELLRIAKKYSLTIERVHTHIGTGGDPKTWEKVALAGAELLHHFPDASILNLGGGFKVPRISTEEHLKADIEGIGIKIRDTLLEFHKKTGREIHLELEPGTFIAANAGALVARVEDVVDTGREGYKFVKVDTGMNDILRPGMYGSQHAIVVLPETSDGGEYVFVGHNCETGDILTPQPLDPESISARFVSTPQEASLVVIEGAGAYCASMSAHGYNSFSDAAEVLLDGDSDMLISRRGTLDDITAREEVG